VDAVARAEAVKSVLKLPEFLSVAAASKRIRNILKQAAEKKLSMAASFRDLPDSPQEEKLLGAYVERNSARIEQFRQAKDYYGALQLLATARETVDAFFDKVMVMVENELMRANRLALLQRLSKEFSTIADFSEIVTEGKA
jgi:glycyl-tRNA synthetase beta chain